MISVAVHAWYLPTFITLLTMIVWPLSSLQSNTGTISEVMTMAARFVVGLVISLLAWLIWAVLT